MYEMSIVEHFNYCRIGHVFASAAKIGFGLKFAIIRVKSVNNVIRQHTCSTYNVQYVFKNVLNLTFKLEHVAA